MASYFVTSIVEGQEFYVTDADPNGVVSAPRSSLAIRSDIGGVGVYINTTAAASGTLWTLVGNISGALNVPLASTAASSGVMAALLELRVDYPAGAANTNITLPARASGFRVTDAHLISGGAGGNVKVQTGAGVDVTPVSLVPGALGAISRATNISAAGSNFAGGSTLSINTDAGVTAGGSIYVRLEPL